MKSSLAKCRIKIIKLKIGHTITKPVPEDKFAYVDVNGNCNIRLHEQREDKYTFPFASIDNLHDIFRKFGSSLSNDDACDDEDG